MKQAKLAPGFEQIAQICKLLMNKAKVVYNGGPTVTINGKKFYATHYYQAKQAVLLWKKSSKKKQGEDINAD